MRPLVLALLAGAASAFVASQAMGQSLTPGEVLSSLSVETLGAPHPVRGADGRVHLAYELFIANPSALFITLDKVEVTGATDDVLFTLQGEQLAGMTINHHGTGPALPPGGSAVLLLDVARAPQEALPALLNARISARRQIAGADGKPAPLPQGYPLPASYSFSAAATPVGPPAVVIAPPLRGPGWVAVNGCCDAPTSHRTAIFAVNGDLRVPERFAIDFVQLNPERHLFTGDVNKLASYAYFGMPVHAVADGTIVNLYDAAVEQVPGKDATDITPANIGGNMLVIDIGGGNFAFYAHLQPGSLKVKLGDKVKTGDVLALLGNTGNSTAPHLHFHVMDGPSPLDANGLPFVFTRFIGQGVADPAGADFFDKPVPAKIDTSRLTGAQQDALPLNNQVVDFGN